MRPKSRYVMLLIDARSPCILNPMRDTMSADEMAAAAAACPLGLLVQNKVASSSVTSVTARACRMDGPRSIQRLPPRIVEALLPVQDYSHISTSTQTVSIRSAVDPASGYDVAAFVGPLPDTAEGRAAAASLVRRWRHEAAAAARAGRCDANCDRVPSDEERAALNLKPDEDDLLKSCSGLCAPTLSGEQLLLRFRCPQRYGSELWCEYSMCATLRQLLPTLRAQTPRLGSLLPDAAVTVVFPWLDKKPRWAEAAPVERFQLSMLTDEGSGSKGSLAGSAAIVEASQTLLSPGPQSSFRDSLVSKLQQLNSPRPQQGSPQQPREAGRLSELRPQRRQPLGVNGGNR
jgi:hypothetical protein